MCFMFVLICVLFIVFYGCSLCFRKLFVVSSYDVVYCVCGVGWGGVGCGDFCLICGVCSWRCYFMGSM